MGGAVMTPPLVEVCPVTDALDRVRDDVVAVRIRGEYAGRLERGGARDGRYGWVCDADLMARLPWPPRSRTYFASPAAALRTMRRRLREAEQAAAEAARIERLAAEYRRRREMR